MDLDTPSDEDIMGSIEGLLDDDLDMIETPTDAPADQPAVDAVEEVEEVDEDEDEDDAEVDEDEEDEDGEGEGEEPKGIADETLVDIQIGEDTYEVNFAELRAGYLRNEDYVTKVQQHEAEYETKVADVEAKQAELAEELQLISVMARSDTSRYDKVNWEALKREDPEKYKDLRLEAIDAKEQADALERRRQTIKAMHEQAQALKQEAYLRRQHELADKLVPGYREPAFLAELTAYGKEVGFTEDEIAGISDARHLLLLNNARLYAQGQVRRKEAKEKAVTKELPPVLKPGQPKERVSTDRQAAKRATARLSSEKSIEAAAALLATFDL